MPEIQAPHGPLAQEVELQRLGLAGLPGGNATRLVHHNTEFGHPRTFTTNSVTTAKYNVATFLPRFLFEVFSQVAYFYFLVQVRRGRLPPCSAGAACALHDWSSATGLR